MNDLCIKISQVNKTVLTAENSLNILSDISLNVSVHEAIVIAGASGSGKTSLLSIMAGLDHADSGQVELLGQDLSQANEEQRAAVRKGKVGFIFQNFQLIQGATALENIALPLQLLGYENAIEQALETLEEVGLSTKKNTMVDLLSGGEQQRVSIARAFAVKPKILFADEPTGNLDSKNGQQIADLMFQLRDQLGTALVLVTHEKSLSKRGDRLITMSAGKIINEE
ncbi:MAG: ABC transporter ATP-binding protein [Gammaproteobacteria bacterium]|nr:ABC transporter ATP-binding protein [Gammaproteobacteria bacterium]